MSLTRGNSAFLNELPGRAEATLAPDRRYRYTLRRTWGGGRSVVFVMLNPSTADATVDDPTIRRCCGFARGFGFDGIHVVNLYALRATNPADLWLSDDPVGRPENDDVLGDALSQPGLAIAAWGANARANRVDEVLAMPGADRLSCLGVTKNGSPRHPLYLPTAAKLTGWPRP